MPPQYWAKKWKKDFWMKPLFGRISDPSTAARGVEQWISSLADTPASRSASPGSEGVPTTPVTCGPKCDGSSRSAAPGCASSRTSPDTYVWALKRSTTTFADWATGLRQASSQRRKSDTRKSESDSSSWPTPDTGLSPNGHGQRGGSSKNGRQSGASLKVAARTLMDVLVPSRPGRKKSKSGVASSSDSLTSPRRFRLNPRFVEFLMGSPIGLTDTRSSATALSLWQQRMRTALSWLP